MARKVKKITEDLELDFELPDPAARAGDGSLDEIFQNYFTPDPPDDETAPDNESFIEAAEAESNQMMADFERADKESLLDKNKSVVNSGADADYFLCVVFVSEEQKKAFLEQSGWDVYGGSRFLNGVAMAKDMGINLPDGYLALSANADKSLTPFTKGNNKNGKSRS